MTIPCLFDTRHLALRALAACAALMYLGLARGAEPTPPASADPAIWGAYAQLVDKDWRSWSNVSIRWKAFNEELVETWVFGEEMGQDAGKLRFTISIRRGERPGRLVAIIDRGEFAGTYNGKVRADGSIKFSRPVLLDDFPYDVKIAGPSEVIYDGSIVGLRAMHAFTRSTSLPADADWGIYSKLVGHQWLVTIRGATQLLTVDWKVPGEVLYERYDALNSPLGYSQLITRSTEKKGATLKAATALPYTRVAYGVVSDDGSIEFRAKGLFALGQRWTLKSDAAGALSYTFDKVADDATSSSMISTATPEGQRLVAEARDAELERLRQARIERSERMDAFNRAMSGLGAGLAAANEVASRKEEASRAELDATLARARMQAERQRELEEAERRRAKQPAVQPVHIRAAQTATANDAVSQPIVRAPAQKAETPRSAPVAAAIPPGRPAVSTPDSNLTATPEAIVVCTRPNADGRFRCMGPVSGGTDGGPKNSLPEWRTPDLMVASWQAQCPSAHELRSSTHRVWGCGFGATNNSAQIDRSAGVDVQGRETYYCHPKETGCRRTAR